MKKTEKHFVFPAALVLAGLLLGSAPALALSPGDQVVPGGQVVGIELRAQGVIVSELG